MAGFRVLFATGIAIIGAACTVLVSAGLSQGAEPRSLGFFYADCTFSHRAPDDPIVFPGEPGRSHLHDFFGSKSTDAFSTNQSLVSTPGTTCHRPDDRSAYWVPTLYDGDGTPIRPNMGSAYYSAEYRDFASIQPFPAGFRMIAGDSTAREQQEDPAVDWTCTPGKVLEEGKSPVNSPRAQALRASVAEAERNLSEKYRAMLRARKVVKRLRLAFVRSRRAARRSRGAGPASRSQRVSLARKRRALARARKAYRARRRAFVNARETRARREGALDAYINGGGTSIPTCKPGAELELHIKFQDCWDGKNLDSPTHKSHVAYSFQERQGSPKTICPKTHPVLLPRLRLRIRYPSLGGPDVRLSPGDVDAGHADFMNGWDQGRLSQLVRDCLNTDRYCGGDNGPVKDDAIPPGEPAPGPPGSPSPSPSPTPEPDPDPDPNPIPIPPLPPGPV